MKRKLRIKTIRQKIILSIFIVIVLCVLFSAFIVSQVVKDQLGEKYEVDKVAATESLSYSLSPVLDLYDYKQVERIIASSLTYENIAYISVFNKGGMLVVSAAEQNVSPEDLDVKKYEMTNNDKVIGSIEIGFSREYINEQIRTTTIALIFGLAGFLILVGLALFAFINRSVINPLGVFTRTVRGMNIDNLSSRVSIHSEDELGILAGSFNQMAEDLQNKINQLETETTERVQAEIKTKQAAKDWDTTFDSIADFISIQDGDCRIVRVNKAFADLYKTNPEELIGKYCYELFHGTDEPGYNCPHIKTMETKKPMMAEYFEPHLGINLEESTSPIFNEKGEVTASIHVARDITERKKMEETLSESEEKYSTVVQQARDGIIIVQDEVMVFANNALFEISGFSTDDLLGKGFLDLLTPESKILVAQRYKNRLEGKEVSTTYETRFECKDGTIKDVEASAGIIQYQGRQATLAIVRDITERKKAEQDIAKFKTIADNSTLGVTITDMNGNITYLNKAHAEMHGYTIDELIGQHYSALYTKDQIKKVMAAREILFAEGSHSSEGWRKRKDGTTFSTMATRTLMKDDRGQPQYIATTHFDLTDRKKAEKELLALNEELQQLNLSLEQKVKDRTGELEIATGEAKVANQSKSDFLASMSHELRTPLNAVIGFSQVLQEQYFGELNEKQTEYVTDINESGQHLLSLINDILDLSKIEAGKMELELSDVKIKELIENSLVMIKEKALVHGIRLDIQCSKELEGLQIMADERKLKQVMFNLLSNAAKFTPDGGSITIKGWKEGELLNISVEDTGIGLAPEDQEKVFGEFYQVQSSLTNKTPGTGLGLPLTRSIMEMHNGKIWVESEGANRGSRFTFNLPIQLKGSAS